MARMRLDVLFLLLRIYFSQGDVLDEGSFSAEELEDDELSKMEDCRPVRLCDSTSTEMNSRAFTSMTRYRLFVALSEKIQTQRPHSHPTQTEAPQRSKRSGSHSPAHSQRMFVCFYPGGMLR